jgi:uncharacterized protein YndB with AHSA1/START domain
MSTKRKANEIYIERVYDATLAQVWDAWTDPVQLEQWWGPRGFTTKTHSKDTRVGGIWHYTMYGPDGVEYINKTLYLEVEPLKRLVYDHGGNDERKPVFRVVAEFSEKDGRTTLEMTMSLPTAEEAAKTRVFIRQAGGNSTWDRLAEHLEGRSSGKDIFVINRTFEAPIDVIFRSWTEPAQISKWLPPVGSTMAFLRADVRPGGVALYAMTDTAGNTMHGALEYLEIKQPTFLSYVQMFCDEKGQVTRHPAEPRWPEKMRTDVTFVEELPNLTRVTVKWEIMGEATTIEREVFANARSGMTQGWTGSLDKLEGHLVST